MLLKAIGDRGWRKEPEPEPPDCRFACRKTQIMRLSQKYGSEGLKITSQSLAASVPDPDPFDLTKIGTSGTGSGYFSSKTSCHSLFGESEYINVAKSSVYSTFCFT
jgi:hypothetical protein